MSLTSGLVSYWPLDEASGFAYDVHGTNTLITIGFIGTSNGVSSGARDFETSGGTRYFSRSDNTGLSVGDIDFCFAGWFNSESSGVGLNRTIFSKNDKNSVSLQEYFFHLDSESKASWSVVSPTSLITTVKSTGAIANNVWTHFYCWHDSVNNQIGLSINNNTPVLATHSGGVRDGANSFQIGANTSTLCWDGLIDEIGFWKRLLTSTERDKLYSVPYYPLINTKSNADFPIICNLSNTNSGSIIYNLDLDPKLLIQNNASVNSDLLINIDTLNNANMTMSYALPLDFDVLPVNLASMISDYNIELDLSSNNITRTNYKFPIKTSFTTNIISLINGIKYIVNFGASYDTTDSRITLVNFTFDVCLNKFTNQICLVNKNFNTNLVSSLGSLYTLHNNIFVIDPNIFTNINELKTEYLNLDIDLLKDIDSNDPADGLIDDSLWCNIGKIDTYLLANKSNLYTIIEDNC